MDSRREFLKKAALLAGGAGAASFFPESVQRAMAISPAPNTTYLDAEHVVILMQENRSFDHSYGKLQGVRGFNDPRAIDLPNKNKVWLQTDLKGDTYAPFRLDIRNTKATWMHDLPHSRESQVDAYNGGKYDKWLTSKRSGHKEYADMPLTLGYYDREDIPFYYALADAFTICDQNFCSSMTPTHPNRYYLWSGTIREKPEMDSLAVVRNSYFSINKPVKWKTFPERMQEAGIGWKFYQNETGAVMQFHPGKGSWLSNFGCNPLERYAQYGVKFSEDFIRYAQLEVEKIRKDLPALQEKIAAATGAEKDKLTKSWEQRNALLQRLETDLAEYSGENFRKLSVFEQELHRNAFVTNRNDPDYLQLSSISYTEGGSGRKIEVPKGDIFYQFRKDVNEGKLPTVSYLAAPQNFSDHPSAPWYGAWYISETLDILTKNPEVWQKTIFILCYDENDGYYDHIPPFSIPDPTKPNSGKVSAGIDVKAEYVPLEQDETQVPKANARGGAIGLGFRVPLVIASPWSRGGKVCSQVFDHTSIIRFLEEFTSHKSGKQVRETNITEWRRTICGNISTVFQPYDASAYRKPQPVNRDEILTTIHKAQFKEVPANFKALNAPEIGRINASPTGSPFLPQQEPGTRPSVALPYELYVNGALSADKAAFEIRMHAGNKVFGRKSAGAPFIIYAMNPYEGEVLRVWNYAVKAGDTLTESFRLAGFESGQYHLRVYGPNGYYREFAGHAQGPAVAVTCGYVLDKNGKPTGDIELVVVNQGKKPQPLTVTDNAYGQKDMEVALPADGTVKMLVPASKSGQWYDFNVHTGGKTGIMRFAGRVETGKEGITDPFMAGTIGRTDNIYARQNLVAWCIVPFDSRERNPEQRARMLNKLGFTMLAYDWREKHIPDFDAELEALKKHHIKLQAFWLYSGPNPESDKNLPIILDLLKRHNVKTEIWCMIGGIKDLDKMTQRQKVEAVARPVAYIADKAAEIGCKVGLYNHGGWYGMPENQLEVMDYLQRPNIGIVYNFHHAEADIERFPRFFPKILPHLMAVNLMGLKKGDPVKVVPVGEGDAEAEMIRIIRDSGYRGPIGIINEETAPDAEVGLTMNVEGLKKILKEQGDLEALKTYR